MYPGTKTSLQAGKVSQEGNGENPLELRHLHSDPPGQGQCTVSAQFLGKESVNQEFCNKDHNQTFSGTENSANEEVRQNEPFEVSKTMEENWR